jgi:hypothetical protein
MNKRNSIKFVGAIWKKNLRFVLWIPCEESPFFWATICIFIELGSMADEIISTEDCLHLQCSRERKKFTLKPYALSFYKYIWCQNQQSKNFEKSKLLTTDLDGLYRNFDIITIFPIYFNPVFWVAQGESHWMFTVVCFDGILKILTTQVSTAVKFWSMHSGVDGSIPRPGHRLSWLRSVVELTIALYLLLIKSHAYRCSLNPITNLNPVYSHSYAWQY